MPPVRRADLLAALAIGRACFRWRARSSRTSPGTWAIAARPARGWPCQAAVCDAVVQAYSDPQLEAGMPLTDDTMRSQTKPLARGDYAGMSFTDAQWAMVGVQRRARVVRVDLRRARRGRIVRVRVISTLAGGRRVVTSRRFRVCS